MPHTFSRRRITSIVSSPDSTQVTLAAEHGAKSSDQRDVERAESGSSDYTSQQTPGTVRSASLPHGRVLRTQGNPQLTSDMPPPSTQDSRQWGS